MKIKFEAELKEAVQFTVELPDSIERYSKNFLIIWNNAREYPREFYKVENNAGNNVYVTCPKESAESVREFLEQFGEIKREGKVFICKPEYIYTDASSNYLDRIYDDTSVIDIVTLAPDLDW